MVVPANPYIIGAQMVTGVMIESIKTLYGIADDINDYINEHIEKMKMSENPTISRTGRVLEMGKYGFGIGYMSSVIVVAVGQLILGNTLAAISTAATAATLTNPIAMTCAAVGAIYYGWSALTEQEKNEILEKLSAGLGTGVELIKSVIRFVTEKAKELFSPENLDEIKKYISNAAHVFGKTLGEVTKKIIDKVSDGLDTIKSGTAKAFDSTAELASEALDSVKEHGGKAAECTSAAFSSVKEQVEKTIEGIKSKKVKDAPKEEFQ